MDRLGICAARADIARPDGARYSTPPERSVDFKCSSRPRDIWCQTESKKAVHDWVHKADLVPTDGASPTHVALDETVIWIDGQQYWLYAAVDPTVNRFLHVRQYFAHTTVLTELFLAALMEKHDVEDAVFLIDSAAWLKAALHRRCLEFRYERHGDRNTIERV